MQLPYKKIPRKWKPYIYRIKLHVTRKYFKRIRSHVNPTTEQLGIDDELEFWKNMLKESKFSERLETRPISQNLIKLIESGSNLPPDQVTIIDVGSGPLTALGTLWGDQKVNVIATDTLGAEFADILKELKIDPPVVPITVEAEQLTRVFDKASVDLIVCSNALDHCRDPFAAIDSMLEILKPGCCIFIWSFENEGANESYQGMHQWDLYEHKGDFYLSGPNCDVSMQKRLRGKASVECKWLPTGPRRSGHIEVIIRKARI